MKDLLQTLQHRQATSGERIDTARWTAIWRERLENDRRDMTPEAIAGIEKFIALGAECLDGCGGGIWERKEGRAWFSASWGLLRVYSVHTRLTDAERCDVYEKLCSWFMRYD